MTDQVDTIIVGAGVVGLAIAREMALSGDEVVVLEAEDAIGTGISARNSEVIHAGIYYPAGSLKAQLCRPGRDALYAYCQSHGIAHRRMGKLVVATQEDELDALDAIKAKAEANGVDDLQPLDRDQAKAMEPALKCAGAVIALSSPFDGGTVSGDGITVRVGGAEPMTLKCRRFINSAGLGAQAVATAIEGLPADSIPPLFYAKGNYFTFCGKSPFRTMIYPVPVQAGLGTHSTLDLAGQTKFGPDVQWVNSPDYAVDASRAEQFYLAIRRYWPDLADGALQPGYVGVRPKFVSEGDPRGDWDIQGPQHHGIDGVVNLFGIESPGLTASLAIAGYVAGLLGKAG